MFDRFLNSHLIIIQWLFNQKFLQNLFFSRRYKLWRYKLCEDLHVYQYSFWLIPAKSRGSISQYTVGPEISRRGKIEKEITSKNYVKQNMGQSRIDNSFTWIGRYLSKMHSSILNYHLKLLHFHVEATVGADLATC